MVPDHQGTTRMLTIIGLLNYLMYLVVDLGMLLMAGYVYIRFTPYDEIRLIRSGNIAASIALAGAMLGYACVVYSATAHGSNIGMTVVWSLISLVLQIGAVELITFVMRDDWRGEMERGDVAHGIILGAFSLAVGLLNAGCLTP